MPIVGGLDIHRKQITFDYLDTVTGQVCRGQISPADREHLRGGLAGPVRPAVTDVAFAAEGCTGWRYVAGELAAAGDHGASWAEPADTVVRLAAASGTPRPTRPTARHLRMLLAEGLSAHSLNLARSHILECRGAAGDLITTCGPSTPPGCSGSTRCCSTRAPRPWARGRCAPGQGVAALRAVTAEWLSPAWGSCRSPPRWRYSRPWRPGSTSCGTS